MSIRFDAAADRLTYTGSIPVPTSGLTITAWVKIVTDQNANSTFFRVYNSGVSTVITCATDVDGTAGNNYFTGGGSPGNGQQMGTGTWRAIAIAHDTGTTGRAYVRIGSTTTVNSGTVSSSTPAGICIGGRDSSDASEWFNGEIAQVRIWSAELTQAQIEAEWASPTPVISTNGYANWPLANATDLTDTIASRVLTTPNGTGQTTGADSPPQSSGTTASAGVAAGTGAALAPTVRINTSAGVATGTGAALGPVANVSTPAGLASGAGAALSPTASTASATTANAGVASGSGAALSPSVRLTVPAGLASGTGAALNPSASSAASATATPGVASGTGAALAPALRVTTGAGLASGSGAALAPAVALTAPAGLASGTGAALTPGTSSVPAVTASAGLASGAGVAPSPIVRLVVIAGLASGSGAALAPTASDGTPPVVIASMRAATRRVPQMAGAVRAGPTSRRSSS